MNNINPKVDNYLSEGCGRCSLGGTPECKVNNWQPELKKLRKIVLECGLTEELKWGVPCYTYNKNNIVLVSAFKEYATVSFLKGALLKDPKKILIKPGENSQASRYIRFTDVSEINKIETIIKKYIFEAIEIEKAGLKVKFKINREPIPKELQKIFDEFLAFKTAFYKLTPGRQRGYILHFSEPKQSKTREGRIQKYTQNILNGIGLHDKYKSKKK